MDNQLLNHLRFLCDESRMLTGITVAYGSNTNSEWAQYGRSQEIELSNGSFIPCERMLHAETIYDLASLTKLFTTVATLSLVESGLLSLDEYVGEIEPRFIFLHHISVGDVLSFRVSLQTPERIDTAPTREEGLRRLFEVKRCPTPAIRVYSDMNAMVIKYIIESKTGKPFFDVVQERILNPAGMSETYGVVPEKLRSRCMCYNYEHRIENERYILRTDTPCGTPHDPKSLVLSLGGHDLCGHAGLFSTRRDMVRFAQALLSGELISRDSLCSIGINRTGFAHGDGTYRQYLGYLCFAKHPLQRLSEVPHWMGSRAIGLSGFTGNHLSIDPDLNRFVLFLGNRCHGRVSHIVPSEEHSLEALGLDMRGVGVIRWPDGRLVPSSAKYVYFKDETLHAPIESRMRMLNWLN